MKVSYVFDAYCGWSYAFAPDMEEVARLLPDTPVQVISGGLFTGERRGPMRQFGFIPAANRRITERTGAVFGERFDALFSEGSFVMDSEAAARGFAALRSAAPDRAVQLARALQEAFFVDGLSLSAEATYRRLAEQQNLPADAVVRWWRSADSAAAAQDDFAQARTRGVYTYPTVLAEVGGRQYTVAQGAASASDVLRRLRQLAADTGVQSPV
jgi:putative protein-disulfide isomerase